ncbi:MAG: PPC domain-containing protein, partial [Cyanobacteria bacterium P01_H01_bin.58]
MKANFGIKPLLLGCIVLGTSSFPTSALAKSVDERHENLLRAVCLNDWEGAIAIVGPLLAAPEGTSAYRQALLDLRVQLTELNRVGTVIPMIDNCEAVLKPYVLAEEIPRQPIDFTTVLLDFLRGGEATLPAPNAHQEAAQAVANLEYFEPSNSPALSPALFISMQSGSSVSAGSVDRFGQAYTFFAGAGDRVTIDINVTRILPWSFTQTDDTQLFLFDAAGTLIAANDDHADSLQSKLEGIVIPATGRYYAVVTTGGSEPVFDEFGHLQDWLFAGDSAVEYTITIAGVTPSDDLILTNYGP